MDGLTEGRVVHYVMPNGHHRAADVVRVWDAVSGLVNLSVKTDYLNDKPYGPDETQLFKNYNLSTEEIEHGHVWLTSVRYSEVHDLGTWHWIEKA